MGGYISIYNRSDSNDERFSKIPIIWVMGGPGCGKATQCARLVEKYGFVLIKWHDIASEILIKMIEDMASGSEKGKLVRDDMAHGGVLPIEVVLDVLKQNMLKEIKNARGYLIEGYPRAKYPADEVERLICPCHLILYYECDPYTLRDRLVARSQKTFGSVDQTQIMNRLSAFNLSTEFYENSFIAKYRSKVVKIPADTDIESVFLATCEEVDRVISSLE